MRVFSGLLWADRVWLRLEALDCGREGVLSKASVWLRRGGSGHDLVLSERVMACPLVACSGVLGAAHVAERYLLGCMSTQQPSPAWFAPALAEACALKASSTAGMEHLEMSAGSGMSMLAFMASVGAVPGTLPRC